MILDFLRDKKAASELEKKAEMAKKTSIKIRVIADPSGIYAPANVNIISNHQWISGFVNIGSKITLAISSSKQTLEGKPDGGVIITSMLYNQERIY